MSVCFVRRLNMTLKEPLIDPDVQRMMEDWNFLASKIVGAEGE